MRSVPWAMAAKALAACCPLIVGSSARESMTKLISSPRRAKAPGLSAITSAYFAAASASSDSRSSRASTPQSAAAALRSPRLVLIAIASRLTSDDRTCDLLTASPVACASSAAAATSPWASFTATSRRRLPLGRWLRQNLGGAPGLWCDGRMTLQPSAAQWRGPLPLTWPPPVANGNRSAPEGTGVLCRPGTSGKGR